MPIRTKASHAFPMKLPLAQRLRHLLAARLVGVLLAVLVAVLAAGILVTTARVRQTMAEGRQKAIAAGQALVKNIDHELDSHVYNVMAMRNVAESCLSGYLTRPGNPADRLRRLPERDGYAALPPGKDEDRQAHGRMVGLGRTPGPDDPVVEEMRMAEALAPLMRAIRDRSPDTPWVYYTSANAFMYLFPSEEAEEFYFTPDLLEMEFLTGATPQANPSRATFWTKPYTDVAGKGQMATVSAPIYQGDSFRGSVSIDVSVKNLQYIMDMYPLPGVNAVLVSDDGQQLARHTFANIPHGAKGYEFHSLPLKLVPWRIELAVDERRLLQDALKDQAALIIGMLLIASVLLFSALLARHARRVRDISIHDGLTGLFNRRHFDEIASYHFDAARRGLVRMGMILADVDYFKKFNDAYGHQKGDRALAGVAEALENTLQRGTDLAFRVGGEEFLILVTLHEQETLHPILAKLNQAVRDLKLPHKASPYGHLTLSLGAIVIDQRAWMDLDAAYCRVDEALYQAKSRGRDCYAMLEAPPVETGHVC
ncbi:Phytochrome-like protein cph2 [Fundidesulfovibrio magnetotacticus]|uniref:diguanylate cyclase n=1 Tax=Fundidesulfovibrio magnetotacticus TaxID=2730080 RepID=A0A6V8LTG3_9BACT|nr:sensor domain-containing diguanylate cyclase [Fundidesulfovibrio magnetotacticus]GFK93871.1 Phytochrome-like protein cph2 [Fundidesulfovibrio magnetotacticus]